MIKLARNITALFAIAICVGCASTPRTLEPEAATDYKRIGVVSVTAQKFSRRHVGTTVFGNEAEQIDSSSWDIDSKYQRQIAGELSAGGFEVVQGVYSRQEFLRVNDLNGPWDAPAFHGPNWGAIEKPIRAYCTENQVHAIAMVFAVSGPDFIGGTNQSMRGAGIYTRGFGSSTRHSVLHLISGVALIDCRMAKPVAVRGLATSQAGSPGQILRASPIASISAVISRMPLDQLSEEQLGSIRNLLANLPAGAWSPTVRALLGR